MSARDLTLEEALALGVIRRPKFSVGSYVRIKPATANQRIACTGVLEHGGEIHKITGCAPHYNGECCYYLEGLTDSILNRPVAWEERLLEEA